ncbi:MAG: hypothetical protein U0Q07_16675 [Acidimicrobiales bacterium]
MTDKSSFSEDDWKVLRDVPIFSASLLLRVGPRNMVSAVHEVEAGKKVLKHAEGYGEADPLIAELAKAAKGQMARWDGQRASAHKGAEATESMLGLLTKANAILDTIPPAEAAGVRKWYVAIAEAVPDGTKHATDAEREMLDRITAIFQ